MPATGRAAEFGGKAREGRRGRSAEDAGPTSAPAPMVLVHGFAQSARSWDAVAAALGASRPVALFELAGHGKRRPAMPGAGPAACAGPGASAPSPSEAGLVSSAFGNPADYDLESQACALLDFLEGFEQRPVLVGYSMGGRVALQALVRHEERFAACVGALILESCGLGPASEDERDAAAERDAANARRLRTLGVQAFMDAWERLPLFASQQELPADVRKRVRAERLANSAEALALTFERAGQHVMPDRGEVVTALRGLAVKGVSLLYVAGQRDSKYSALAAELKQALAASSPSFAATTAALVTGGAVGVAVVPYAGHNVHLENPEAFCALLEREVARLV